MPDPTGNHHHAATTTDHHGAARIIRVAATALAHCYLAASASLHSRLELMSDWARRLAALGPLGSRAVREMHGEPVGACAILPSRSVA